MGHAMTNSAPARCPRERANFNFSSAAVAKSELRVTRILAQLTQLAQLTHCVPAIRHTLRWETDSVGIYRQVDVHWRDAARRLS